MTLNIIITYVREVIMRNLVLVIFKRIFLFLLFPRILKVKIV